MVLLSARGAGVGGHVEPKRGRERERESQTGWICCYAVYQIVTSVSEKSFASIFSRRVHRDLTSIVSQKTVIFIMTAVSPSNVASLGWLMKQEHEDRTCSRHEKERNAHEI
jgi:hypothetical protein